MAHILASIGHGYTWPSMSFEGIDGNLARLKSSPYQSPTSTIRYLNAFEGFVSSSSLEKAIVQFVETILSRLYEFGLKETGLSILWNDVSSERRNQRLGNVRRLEALLSIDPDEQTEFIEGLLVTWSQKIGHSSLEEIAASSHADSIQQILTSTDRKSREIPLHGRDSTFNQLRANLEPYESTKLKPWLYSRNVAYQLRDIWALGSSPISDQNLSDRLEIPLPELVATDRNVSFPFGVNDKSSGRFGFALSRSKPESRRFDTARLLGDQIITGLNERLIPATASSTLRQKMQRAFAAEFLCPSKVVAERTSNVQTGDELAKVLSQTAEEFNVSEAIIEHHFDNLSITSSNNFSYYF